MSNFKIVPHNQKLPRIFEKEKKKIAKAINDDDIHHIGSTAVPGLGGKGIIDIMIGIRTWKKAEKVIEKLKNIGFNHIHPKEKGRIFLSKHQGSTPGNIHIHIIKKGGKQYEELLAFRDYLRKNKPEVKRFFKLKLEWLEKAKGDRFKYNKLKEKYVKDILNRV